MTDEAGVATFQRGTAYPTVLRLIVGPLTKFLPVMCAPSGKVYRRSEFVIDLPQGYVFKVNGHAKTAGEIYQLPDDLIIRCPNVSLTNGWGNRIELSFFNRREAFDYTLKLYSERQ
jgi:hypothetical protein